MALWQPCMNKCTLKARCCIGDPTITYKKVYDVAEPCPYDWIFDPQFCNCRVPYYQYTGTIREDSNQWPARNIVVKVSTYLLDNGWAVDWSGNVQNASYHEHADGYDGYDLWTNPESFTPFGTGNSMQGIVYQSGFSPATCSAQEVQDGNCIGYCDGWGLGCTSYNIPDPLTGFQLMYKQIDPDPPVVPGGVRLVYPVYAKFSDTHVPNWTLSGSWTRVDRGDDPTGGGYIVRDC